LLAEWQWVMTQAVGKGAILGPLIWRLVLHTGLAIMVWQAWLFIRDRASVGRGGRVHGIVIGAAGIAIVVAVALWRVVGAFPPWWSW
jgi:hypothetical protein